jgi:threonine dehydrogenase-like Zn-dependent dehydrogenase
MGFLGGTVEEIALSSVNVWKALWFVGPGRAELKNETPQAGDVRVRTAWSGISRGTERLVFEGRVPPSTYATMRAPFQSGAFPFPVKYGYCAVGMVEEGPESLLGRAVFCLHPHQSLFTVPETAVTPLPPDLPPRRAILAANMETALNGVWDGGVAPGDRVAIVGGGAVGLLITALVAAIPGTDCTLVDTDATRAPLAERLGAAFTTPADAPTECDVCYHASASAAGLATALDALAMDGTLVEMSWHGEGATPVPLGGAFHARRIRLISSQVGHLPPARLPRWDYGRRMAKALSLLAKMPALDALISEDVAFDALPEALPRLLAPGAPGIVTAVRYG